MRQIKAIETAYQGYRFRSRTEARWAVFFDALGVKWQYEIEGFDLGSAGWYLPDFYLPELDTYIEIKPWRQYDDWPTDGKAFELAELLQEHVVVLCGEPGPVDIYTSNNAYNGFIPGDNSYYWCECPGCGAVGIQFDGRSERNKHRAGCQSYKRYGLESRRIVTAWMAARAARFEHGEQWKPNYAYSTI